MSERDEWINVKERLPDNDDSVVVCHCDGHREIGRYNSPGQTWTVLGYPTMSVRYWMPLPKPPKRESSLSEWFRIHRNEMGISFDETKIVWDAAITASRREDFVP